MIASTETIAPVVERKSETIEDASNALEVLDADGYIREYAYNLVLDKRNDSNIEIGEVDPISGDLVGGARLAVALENTDAFDEAYGNHKNDVRTTYTEALLTLMAHISEVEAGVNGQGEAAIGDITFVELFLRNAANGNAEVCTAEIVEELISATLYNKENLRNDYYLGVISPSRPDTEGNTMMIRLLEFEEDGKNETIRKSRQAYINNSNTADANILLKELGILNKDDQDLDEVGILSTPFLINKQRFPNGVVDVVQMLDYISSERTGYPVFFGAKVDASPDRTMYTNLPEASKVREEQMQDEIDKFAEEIYQMVSKGDLSFTQEKEAYSNMLLSSLRRICSQYPEYAEAAFGKKAAEHYHQAYDSMIDGDASGADAALASAFEESTSVTVCDTVVSQSEVQSQASLSASEAERREALHCIELKNKGHTIRRCVCPACKRKVNAYETEESILCMSKDCGYEIEKGSGKVLQASKIVMRNEPIDYQDSTMSVEKTKIIKPGQTLKILGHKYKYREDLSVGGIKRVLVGENGQEITGKAASDILASLESSSQAA